jgi:hypothetical protein
MGDRPQSLLRREFPANPACTDLHQRFRLHDRLATRQTVSRSNLRFWNARKMDGKGVRVLRCDVSPSFLVLDPREGHTQKGVLETDFVARSFLVQIGGRRLSLSHKATTAKRGIHIVTAGVLFQELLIVVFFCLSVKASQKVSTILSRVSVTLRTAKRQIHVVQVSLALITVNLFHFFLAGSMQADMLKVSNRVPDRRVCFRPGGFREYIHHKPRVVGVCLRCGSHV